MDPIGQLTHTHEHLTQLALTVARLMNEVTGAGTTPSRPALIASLDALRDGLLQHFALEEEGLFPFLREHVPSRAATIERLESGHDALCGAIVRLAYLARDRSSDHGSSLEGLHVRFSTGYSEHSRAESLLFADLGQTLDSAKTRELAALLDGL
jgi:hypothetical protein